MPTPVSDPEILKQLMAKTPVSDPAILEQLNARQPLQAPSLLDGMSPELRQQLKAPTELRAAPSTTREKIGALLSSLAGGEGQGAQPSLEAEKLIGGLVGSTGLGSTGASVVDFTPARIPLFAEEAYGAARQGNYGTAALNTLGAVPIPLLNKGIDAAGSALGKVASAFGKADVPTEQMIREAARAGYENPAVKELQIDPSALRTYADKTKSVLEQTVNNRQAPTTFGILDDIKKMADEKTVGNEFTPLIFNDIQSQRQILGAEARNYSATPQERRAASIAKKELEKAFEQLTPEQVIRGDVSKANPILKEADKNYRAASKMQDFQTRMEAARIKALTSKNLPKEQQNATKSLLLEDNKKDLYLNDKNISALERLAGGGTGENIMRGLGGMMSPDGIKGILTSGALATVGALTGGGALGAVALPLVAKGIGSAFKGAAAKVTSKNVSNVVRGFAEESPLAIQMRRSPLKNPMTISKGKKRVISNSPRMQNIQQENN